VDVIELPYVDDQLLVPYPLVKDAIWDAEQKGAMEMTG
jgi:hypothetical protein